MVHASETENVWVLRPIYEEALSKFHEKSNKSWSKKVQAATPLANEVAKARQLLIESRDSVLNQAKVTSVEPPTIDVAAFKFFEKKVLDYEKILGDLKNVIVGLEGRIESLEKNASISVKKIDQKPVVVKEENAPKKEDKKENDDDDDVDLFGSDSEGETEEKDKIREERLAAYAAKKSKKPVLIAKSNVILDVKPWSDDTDMKEMEDRVRQITADGLLWGASKLVPLAYGIHKLSISSVVEDDKVSIDWLQEKIIEEIEELVQSVDVAAFNKI